MPLDAICMQAVVRETAAQIENARIEKIQQPARDQVILLLRGGRRLLLNAGASQPRLHLTWQLRDNPAQPPMFCMLLRKHLAGGRLLRLEQEPLERVVTLTIRAVDELGEQSDYRLILEAMPRHANLILVDREGRIVDCLRRVDGDMSAQRQLLPWWGVRGMAADWLLPVLTLALALLAAGIWLWLKGLWNKRKIRQVTA